MSIAQHTRYFALFIMNGPLTTGTCVEVDMDDGKVDEIESESAKKCKRSKKDATASLTLSRTTLNRIVAGKFKAADALSSGDIKLKGDKNASLNFLGMLDTFDPWYNLITP